MDDIEYRPLRLSVSDPMRAKIHEHFAASGLEEGHLALVLADAKDGSEECWSIAAYDRAGIEGLKQRLNETGEHFFYVIEGIAVVIFQTQLLAELEGKTLTLVDDRETVV
jgi:hypothetical protein